MGDNTTNGKELEEQAGQFGADRAQKGQVAFDGKRAMTYLKAICDLGPRISGTKQMRQQQELIKKHFEDLKAKVTFQTFKAKQNSVAGEVEMTNIIVSYLPERKRRVILCTHYDTRPIADQEKDPRDWRKPFLSANDGGSGVALLMELGNHMKDLKTNVGVDFVFFDGEEYIYRPSGENKDVYFIGSEHFAKTWKNSKDRCDYSAAILFDMIAGKDLKLPVEINSYRKAYNLAEEVWGIAQEVKARAFIPRTKHEVLDDHISLLDMGIPAIDIIDFDYEHWHKLSDTPSNCSAASMEQVARVVTTWLQRTK
jgi:Zn-dependent M28 family amino/carboxypeptidase